jgi:hypothetical protein
MKATDRSAAQPDNAKSKPNRPTIRMLRPNVPAVQPANPFFARHNAPPNPLAQEGGPAV